MDPAQHLNLDKLIDKCWWDDDDPNPDSNWLNVEVDCNTRIRITPGERLLLVLRALRGEEKISRDVPQGELQRYLAVHPEWRRS